MVVEYYLLLLLLLQWSGGSVFVITVQGGKDGQKNDFACFLVKVKTLGCFLEHTAP